MKKSTLFSELIEFLTPEDRDRFQSFLAYRKREKELELYIHLKKLAFEPYHSKDLESYFGADPNKLAHALGDELKYFLACDALASDKHTESILFLNRLQTVKPAESTKVALHYLKKAQNKLDKEGRGSHFFSVRYDLLQIYKSVLTTMNHRVPQHCFPALEEANSAKMELEALRLKILRENFFNIFDREQWLEEVNLGKPSYLYSEIKAFYLCLLELISGKMVNRSSELVAMLERIAKKKLLKDTELTEAFGWCSNFLLKAYLRKGGVNEAGALFGLYESGLRHEVLLREGKVPMRVFRNAVEAGLRSESLDRMQGFYDTYVGKLEEQFASEAVALCELSFGLFRQEYSQTLEQVVMKRKEIVFHNPLLGLQARILELKCLYEWWEVGGQNVIEVIGGVRDIKIVMQEKAKQLELSITQTQLLKNYKRDSLQVWLKYFRYLLRHYSELSEKDKVLNWLKDLGQEENVDDLWWLEKMFQLRIHLVS